MTADIYHTTGYKDDYKVVVEPEGDEWAPTNEELFELISKWFEAEEHAFGDGYGKRMPLFYVCLIALGHEDKAITACDIDGASALEHFEEQREEHMDDVIEYL